MAGRTTIDKGIQAIRQGKHVEGGRLLRIALRDENPTGKIRATVLLWLAETKSTRQEKLDCYHEALAADPENEHAQQRLAALLSAGLPPVPGDTLTQPAPSSPPEETTQSAPSNAPPPGVPGQASGPPQGAPRPPSQQQPQAARYNPENPPRTVGILGGPSGPGTGFFVTRDGLVATTRFVVGGEEEVTIELERGETMRKPVARAYPELDLAFIDTGLRVNQLPTTYAAPVIPENMPLTALSHRHRAMSGQRRATRSEVSTDWFPTTIDVVNDAGGNPIYNDQNTLIGMLTHNANRTSDYVYGLNIHTISRYVEYYMQEARAIKGKPSYCPHCGYLSHALTVGGYYCEVCGGLLPHARDIRRAPRPQLSGFYGENKHRPCPHCEARVGYYDGRCLRCGQSPQAKR